jgi:hypothetical protein
MQYRTAIYWMSLIFTLIGAVIFAVVKGHYARIPQEAIIGVTTPWPPRR